MQDEMRNIKVLVFVSTYIRCFMETKQTEEMLTCAHFMWRTIYYDLFDGKSYNYGLHGYII